MKRLDREEQKRRDETELSARQARKYLMLLGIFAAGGAVVSMLARWRGGFQSENRTTFELDVKYTRSSHAASGKQAAFVPAHSADGLATDLPRASLSQPAVPGPMFVGWWSRLTAECRSLWGSLMRIRHMAPFNVVLAALITFVAVVELDFVLREIAIQIGWQKPHADHISWWARGTAISGAILFALHKSRELLRIGVGYLGAIGRLAIFLARLIKF